MQKSAEIYILKICHALLGIFINKKMNKYSKTPCIKMKVVV